MKYHISYIFGEDYECYTYNEEIHNDSNSIDQDILQKLIMKCESLTIFEPCSYYSKSGQYQRDLVL